MTAQTEIIHKPWCREHQTAAEGTHCDSGGFEWGPMLQAQRPFAAHRKGVVWAAQQLGVDERPFVALEDSDSHGGHWLAVEDPLPLRTAIDGLLEVFGIAQLSSITNAVPERIGQLATALRISPPSAQDGLCAAISCSGCASLALVADSKRPPRAKPLGRAGRSPDDT